MNKKNQVYLILAILLLAFSLRSIYLLQTKDNPLFYPVDNGLDSSLYHQRAKLIVQGMGLSPDFIYGMPGYPYFLALIYKLCGENIFTVRLIQMLLGSLNSLLIYFIGKQLFGQRVAYISMFLCALYGMFIFYEGMLLGTTLTILFNCLIMLTMLSIQRKSSFKKWFLLGLLVGLGGLNQAGILLFIPFILFWFSVARKVTLKIKFLSQLMLLTTCILVISPITIRNYLIAKDFIPLTAHSGINFYIGNNPNADGSFKPPPGMHLSIDDLFADSIIQAQKLTGRQMKPSEVSKFWFAQGIQFIKSQPLSYCKLLFRKFVLLFNGQEIFDVEDYFFFRQKFPTVLNIPLPNLRVILPLALLGVCVSTRQGKKYLLLYLFIASYSISILAYFVNARYRLPLVPFLIIFAGVAIERLVLLGKNKEVVGLLLALGGLILFFLATNVKIVQQNFVSQYNNLGVAYKAIGKYELAIEAYKEALKIEPGLAQTHSNLGNLYNTTGQYPLAIEEFCKSLESDPNLAEAHSNLGIVYTKIGKIDQAAGEYKRAIELRPNLVEAHFNLGVIYQKRGEIDLAAEQFEQTIKFAPHHAEAHNNLGAVYNAQGKLKLAEDEFRAAVALKTDFLQAHYNLGLIYFKENLFPQAKSEWQRVLEIDPQFTPAEENLKKLEQLRYSR